MTTTLVRTTKLILTLAGLALATTPAYAARVCEAPTTGPGAPVYDDFSGVQDPESIGAGANQFIIYEPTHGEVTPELPVIVYLHGFAWWPSPESSLQFVQHLVKKGHIVIWPYYENILVAPNDYVANAGLAVSAALEHIKTSDHHHAQPELDADGNVKYALVGHSAGAVTAANLAATYGEYGLPAPKALVCMHPGRGSFDEDTGEYPIPTQDYSGIDPDTYMLIVSGDVDTDLGSHGRFIWDESVNHVKKERKNWILVRSDDFGNPNANDLTANHLDPIGEPGNNIDCHDWYGYWKWTTALSNLAFHGTDGQYALGNTPDQRFMGVWVRPYYRTVLRDVNEPDVCCYEPELGWSSACGSLIASY